MLRDREDPEARFDDRHSLIVSASTQASESESESDDGIIA